MSWTEVSISKMETVADVGISKMETGVVIGVIENALALTNGGDV